MNNFILLQNKKRNSDKLKFVGNSVLNGQYVYEILLDKIDKSETLTKQLRCKFDDIVIEPEETMSHISVLQMKNTVNIYDPYDYKNFKL